MNNGKLPNFYCDFFEREPRSISPSTSEIIFEKTFFHTKKNWGFKSPLVERDDLFWAIAKVLAKFRNRPRVFIPVVLYTGGTNTPWTHRSIDDHPNPLYRENHDGSRGLDQDRNAFESQTETESFLGNASRKPRLVTTENLQGRWCFCDAQTILAVVQGLVQIGVLFLLSFRSVLLKEIVYDYVQYGRLWWKIKWPFLLGCMQNQ